MKQQATYRIFGAVENVEIGSAKIETNDPVADIHISVFVKNGIVDRYRVTAYEPSLVAIAQSLRHGQQICVAGRIRGNERGYYNYYLTAQAILVEPKIDAPSRQEDPPSRGSSSVPPSGSHPSELGYGTPAAKTSGNLADEDIPF